MVSLLCSRFLGCHAPPKEGALRDIPQRTSREGDYQMVGKLQINMAILASLEEAFHGWGGGGGSVA